VTDDLTFVLCIENNAIRAQALLLCESIRQFGGRHSGAPIFAVSPRLGLGVDRECRQRLDAMSVEYAEADLNRVCPEYGSANRVFAAAWAEGRARSKWIVVLDSDTVFLDELELPNGYDAGVRPVDSKGSATEGPRDPFDDYWTKLAEIQGVSLDCLPLVRTTDRRHLVRASYNGGLTVVRREMGILSSWADLFSRSVVAGLRPWKDSGLNIHASTGLVGPQASEYWGSNQAAAALAIWGATTRVFHYPDSYNAPLHLLMDDPELATGLQASPLIHAHYHWLFTHLHHVRAIATLQRLGVGRDRLEWLTSRLPLQ
jgi:hypothetical protein